MNQLQFLKLGCIKSRYIVNTVRIPTKAVSLSCLVPFVPQHKEIKSVMAGLMVCAFLNHHHPKILTVKIFFQFELCMYSECVRKCIQKSS